MSTYHNTYICYTCMEARRADLSTGILPKCPKCRQSMVRLHYKIRIPKKKRKLWIAFREWLTTTYVYYKDKL